MLQLKISNRNFEFEHVILCPNSKYQLTTQNFYVHTQKYVLQFEILRSHSKFCVAIPNVELQLESVDILNIILILYI